MIVGIRRAKEVSRKMQEHCGEMAAHCKEIMASKKGGREVPSEREVDERSKKQPAAVPAA